jgi:hypothetical protein
MSFCELFICITLIERRNVVDDSINNFYKWLRLSWVDKRMKNLLIFTFKSKLIIVKSYCMFCCVEKFIVCWNVASERICVISMTWNRFLIDAVSSFVDVSKCMNDLLFYNVSNFCFFFRFNVVLKTSRRMLVDVINTFFVFIECFAFKRRMLARAEIAFFINFDKFCWHDHIFDIENIVWFCISFQNIRRLDANNRLTNRLLSICLSFQNWIIRWLIKSVLFVIVQLFLFQLLIRCLNLYANCCFV